MVQPVNQTMYYVIYSLSAINPWNWGDGSWIYDYLYAISAYHH